MEKKKGSVKKNFSFKILVEKVMSLKRQGFSVVKDGQTYERPRRYHKLIRFNEEKELFRERNRRYYDVKGLNRRLREVNERG